MQHSQVGHNTRLPANERWPRGWLNTYRVFPGRYDFPFN